jgi:hypothetical protein
MLMHTTFDAKALLEKIAGHWPLVPELFKSGIQNRGAGRWLIELVAHRKINETF